MALVMEESGQGKKFYLSDPLTKRMGITANGRQVILGIRPEDIHDSEMFLASSPSTVMESTVKVYELLGAEVFLYFDIADTQVTARVDPRTTAKTGDPVKFAFDMEKAHFFDKETEQTITN